MGGAGFGAAGPWRQGCACQVGPLEVVTRRRRKADDGEGWGHDTHD